VETIVQSQITTSSQIQLSLDEFLTEMMQLTIDDINDDDDEVDTERYRY
jgi:hypothetical protein